jgi:hypothetical protein
MSTSDSPPDGAGRSRCSCRHMSYMCLCTSSGERVHTALPDPIITIPSRCHFSKLNPAKPVLQRLSHAF